MDSLLVVETHDVIAALGHAGGPLLFSRLRRRRGRQDRQSEREDQGIFHVFFLG